VTTHACSGRPGGSVLVRLFTLNDEGVPVPGQRHAVAFAARGIAASGG